MLYSNLQKTFSIFSSIHYILFIQCRSVMCSVWLRQSMINECSHWHFAKYFQAISWVCSILSAVTQYKLSSLNFTLHKMKYIKCIKIKGCYSFLYKIFVKHGKVTIILSLVVSLCCNFSIIFLLISTVTRWENQQQFGHNPTMTVSSP